MPPQQMSQTPGTQDKSNPDYPGPGGPASRNAKHKARPSDLLQRQHLRSGPTPALEHLIPTSRQSSGHDDEATGQTWFDRYNATAGQPQLSMDGEPPFYPRGPSSSSSDLSSDLPKHVQKRTLAPFTQPGNQAPTEKTDSDDFRSIIDDLTVENRALKERLRKYEASLAQTAEAQQDQLFAVTVHGLPGHRKRELIETLTAFAQRHDVLKETQPTEHQPVGAFTPYVSVNRSARPFQSALNSPSSGQLDSCYASASTPGQLSSTADQRKQFLEQKSEAPAQIEQESFDDTPAGLLYKASFMTEREKKIMVVKRLEHLFRENKRARLPKAGRSTTGQSGYDTITDGMREANILSGAEDFHDNPDILDADAATATEGATDVEDKDQRPTGPLDVDPNRIQNPTENIRYIRHLGISPELSSDDAPDAHNNGWVYLNLLFNLAQLHIFNVTPDFVRAAITEVSTRFELSPDRQKVRWRGGQEDTKPSSDSDGDRTMRDLTTDSSGTGSKRQKLADSTNMGGQYNNLGGSKTASETTRAGSARGRRRHDLEYKPLFVKRKSADKMHHYDDAASGYFHKSANDGDVYGSAPGTMTTQTTGYSHFAHPRSDSGPIVFFSGALFMTDLSGDSNETIVQSQPRYIPYDSTKSNVSPLGTEQRKRPRPKLRRSDSGSRLRSRPFKDYSKCAEMLQQDTRLKTPEPMCSDDADSNDMNFSLKWTDDSNSASPQERILMEASGIGGTKPEDNFVVIVETAHPKMRSDFHKELQAQVAASLDPERKTAKLLHMIEEAKIAPATSAPTQQPMTRGRSLTVEAPVKITVLSKRELRLPPSETPPPAQLWDDDSDSDDDSDAESSGTDRCIIGLKKARPEMTPMVLQEESEDDDDNDVDDSDDSIDMMGFDRKANPTLVAERESGWKREAEILATANSGSEDATAGGGDDEDSGEEEDGDDGDNSREDNSDDDDRDEQMRS